MELCRPIWVLVNYFDVFNNCFKPFKALGIQFVLEADLWPNMQLMHGLFYLFHTRLTCSLVGYKYGEFWKTKPSSKPKIQRKINHKSKSSLGES